MKKLIFLSLLAFSCSNPKEESKPSEQPVQKSNEQIIEVELKYLMDEFESSENEYNVTQKYVGKTVKLTCRVSTVKAGGEVLLQVKEGKEALHCYNIGDSDFLSSLKKNDKVAITGILDVERYPVIGLRPILKNCTKFSKL